VSCERGVTRESGSHLYILTVTELGMVSATLNCLLRPLSLLFCLVKLDFALARQVLYHLSHTASLFFFIGTGA
jgi:hypothetical protein